MIKGYDFITKALRRRIYQALSSCLDLYAYFDITAVLSQRPITPGNHGPCYMAGGLKTLAESSVSIMNKPGPVSPASFSLSIIS
jgi:hypothetical protein